MSAELEATIAELRKEIVELKEVIKDMARALAVLTKKDKDAQAFHERIAAIAEWEAAVQVLEDEKAAEDGRD